MDRLLDMKSVEKYFNVNVAYSSAVMIWQVDNENIC